jgi:hypothetical protein
MAINFPNSPAVDDEHIVNSVTYKWDGVKWINISDSIGTTGKIIAMAMIFG